jgi:hypothetical protein
MGLLRTILPFALIALGVGCARPSPETPQPMRSTALVPLYTPLAASIDAEPHAGAELTGLARLALSSDAAVAQKAEAELRRRGPAGLDALLTVDDGSPRAGRVIDAVAKQRDARASRLYWYTDLERAQKAAAASGGRPILSLRMLGRLDEDLSCANSRFFRTALYPNAQVSAYLRATYVLHWSSERPAPKITVDYGDGHRLERTITGNSIHYVLDANGRLVDAIPGLYGPKAFRGMLQNAALAAAQASAPGAPRGEVLQRYHRGRLATIAAAWNADLAFLGVTAALPQPAMIAQPSAADAVPIAVPKAAVEAPMVAAILPGTRARPLSAQALESATSVQLWTGIAARRMSDVKLDARSLALMKRKSGSDSGGFARRVAGFERLMALDTVKNEYILHRRIHEWILEGALEGGMAALNSRVYTELFLTPRTDPWLGLVAPDTYTGIDNEGLTQP